MRLTWVVLGVVAAAGVIAFLSGSASDEAPEAGTEASARPGLRKDGTQALSPLDEPLDVLAPADGTEAAERRAQEIRVELAKAEAAGDQGTVAKLEATLDTELGDTLVARRRAFRKGLRMLREVPRERGEARIRFLDRTRRLLSAGVYLPEHFHKDGRSTDRRTKLLRKLDELNRIVMTYAPRPDGGLEGVTAPYEVPAGVAPVQIVSRQKLRAGHNAILFWHQGGNLDPSRLRAGATLLLPQEELTLHVYQNYRRLGVFIGDWFVKEFRVGVGKDESPTPVGTFEVYRKQQNPDWTATIDGRKVVIRYGDPRNELGDAWIHIRNNQYSEASGYGIHGTNAPDTIGKACSNGCVRLVNDQARELFYWVRTASAGGQATRIFIRYGPIPGSDAPAPPK